MAVARAKVPASHLTDADRKLTAFFLMQGEAIAAKWPASKSRKDIGDVLNLERWNRALTEVIGSIALTVSTVAGRSVLADLGLKPRDYDQPRTAAWIAQHASGVAAGINGRTRDAVRDALAANLSADDVRKLFEGFANGRAPQIARTEVTAATGFGTREAAQQSGMELVKTWKTGRNPRQSHARLDGQSRPMGELFSNGARWPGDSLLDDKERSNCNCSMTVDRRTS